MLLFTLREGRKKKTQERERERDLSVFFLFGSAQSTAFAVVIKSARARTPRAMNSYRLSQGFVIIAKKKRELSFVTLSLSLSVFTLSLSLCVFLLLLFVFTFHPKGEFRYKNKLSSLPSLSHGRKYALIIGSNCYRL